MDRALAVGRIASNKGSVCRYGLPYWLASYLAKKITRRVFSVYRSNTISSLLPRGPHRCGRSRASTKNAVLQSQDAVATRGERQVVCRDQRRQLVRAMQPLQ